MRRWVLAALVLLLLIGSCGLSSAGYVNIDQYGVYSMTEPDDPRWTNATHNAKASLYIIFRIHVTTPDHRVNAAHKNHVGATLNTYPGSCTVGTGWQYSYLKEDLIDVFSQNYYISDSASCCTGGCAADVDDPRTIQIHFYPTTANKFTLTGDTRCLDDVTLYIYTGSEYIEFGTKDLNISDSYSFSIIEDTQYKLVFSDGAYYEFTCDGNEVFNYDVCIYVYGYTCGIEHIKLYKDDGGWVLEDTYYQATIGVNPYEMIIESGNDYKLEFSDGHEYLFSCTGDHVLYDWDRCAWVDPPNGDPVPIIIYVGYDNRIVLLQDAHGNFIEHSQIAVYDQTDDIYLQKWTDNPEGYMVLAARFDTDHDVQIAVRTFDSVHTTTTVYPMNGTAENLTWTNWTIPIMYNIQMEPVDTYNVPLFDVFCGLAEYTPVNPLSFWGMDFNRGYVPVTNCSGFSRCDIIAEKGGYAPYEVTGLNWTSRSAMVKDYRHEIVMVKE